MVLTVKSTNEFKDANKKESRTEAEPNAKVVNWTPPPQGVYKVNWDAYLSKRSSKAGIEIIVRDHEGSVIATKRMKVSYAPDSRTAESLGAYHAVQFVLEIGVRKIIIEGNALNVVNYIKQVDNSCRYSRAIIWDIKNGFAQLDYWEVVHIERGSNIVVDALAKSALSISEDAVELESCPSCIVSLI
ncbi:uncharacterized protein LOC121265866 [Juglans microcarpa x Juglans regia]|uniref:uncharacterized protein LOC121265866 n=1 Tax=Juglans microcarpa x Juglans regia TaxID=2249226 RepID=UPI001B7ECAA8|nr:uncharacterized protein LOC121265866 [Juglans microcarpa x Juglans regia]